jgi:hypothetical protein
MSAIFDIDSRSAVAIAEVNVDRDVMISKIGRDRDLQNSAIEDRARAAMSSCASELIIKSVAAFSPRGRDRMSRGVYDLSTRTR